MILRFAQIKHRVGAAQIVAAPPKREISSTQRMFASSLRGADRKDARPISDRVQSVTDCAACVDS